MKLFTYIKYFLFVGINWKWHIAFYLLKDNLYGEKKYGIETIGVDKLKKLKQNGIDISNATLYMPVSYKLLENLFNQINLSSYNHFIDIGCGKGRAICTAAFFGIKKITGIDFSEQLCVNAKQNVEKIIASNKTSSIDIETIDAAIYQIPNDVDCIFLFNPFNEQVLQKVVQNILKSYTKCIRSITVIYVNPIHSNLFIDAGFKQIYHTQKMIYLEAIILQLNH